MGSRAQGEGSDVPRKRGLGRYVQRMKTVLRPGGKHSRDSTGAATSTPSTSQVPDASQAPTAAAMTPSTAVTTAQAATSPVAQLTDVTTIPRAQVEQERARKLAQIYGLTIEPHQCSLHEWSPPSSTVQRTDKSVRMRIHRTCHGCGETFGSSKICVNCDHARCIQCPWYPVKKSKTEVPAARGTGAPQAVPEKMLELKRPSRTGGQDLVRKKPTQRVRRTCHECDTLFLGTKTCSKCSHVRCVECPRDPPKPHLYPDGYPGDAPAPDNIPPDRVKHPTRYQCHACDALFARCSTTCSCGHEKCDECPRAPPRKAKQREFDADLLRRVEERLAALAVTTSGRPKVEL